MICIPGTRSHHWNNWLNWRKTSGHSMAAWHSLGSSSPSPSNRHVCESRMNKKTERFLRWLTSTYKHRKHLGLQRNQQVEMLNCIMSTAVWPLNITRNDRLVSLGILWSWDGLTKTWYMFVQPKSYDLKWFKSFVPIHNSSITVLPKYFLDIPNSIHPNIQKSQGESLYNIEL